MKYIYILVYLLFIPTVLAGTLQVSTPNIFTFNVNMSNYSGLTNQIIINIPDEVFTNISYIDSIRFLCGRTFHPPPDQNMVIRIYKGNAPTLSFDSSYGIPASACPDYGAQISLTLYDPVNFNAGDSMAIGFYSLNTLGDWYFLADSTMHQFSAPYSAYHEIITNASGTSWIDIEFGEIVFSPIWLYGGLIIPTPTPTPTYIPPGGTYTGTPIPGSDGIPDTPHDNPYDPNSTTSPYSSVPNGSGFDSMLRANGQCTNNSVCTARDMTIWLENYIELFWWIGVVCIIVRFYSFGG